MITHSVFWMVDISHVIPYLAPFYDELLLLVLLRVRVKVRVHIPIILTILTTLTILITLITPTILIILTIHKVANQVMMKDLS